MSDESLRSFAVVTNWSEVAQVRQGVREAVPHLGSVTNDSVVVIIATGLTREDAAATISRRGIMRFGDHRMHDASQHLAVFMIDRLLREGDMLKPGTAFIVIYPADPTRRSAHLIPVIEGTESGAFEHIADVKMVDKNPVLVPRSRSGPEPASHWNSQSTTVAYYMIETQARDHELQARGMIQDAGRRLVLGADDVELSAGMVSGVLVSLTEVKGLLAAAAAMRRTVAEHKAKEES